MDPATLSDTARRFTEALHAVEERRETSPLAELTAPDAPVLSIDGRGERRGPDGMAELFTQYLAQFERVETTFTAATEGNGRAALEWRSTAVLAVGGAEVEYTGVTVVDLDGDLVSGFRTVYDSGALLRRAAGGAPTAAAGSSATAGSGSPADGTGAADGTDHHGGPAGGDGGGRVDPDEQAGGTDATVGHYGADSGFLPREDREAATGER